MSRRDRHDVAMDKAIGAKIKARRMQLGLSQGTVGAHLNISFQQQQKYEKGTNRISAARLQRLAEFLDVPHAYFVIDGKPLEMTPLDTFLSNKPGIALMKVAMTLTAADLHSVTLLARSLARKAKK